MRVTVLSDPDLFEVYVGLVLLYFGARLLYGVIRPSGGGTADSPDGSGRVGAIRASLRCVEYGYGGKTYTFGTTGVFALSLAVGVVGGIYSIGGDSIIAPFLVTVFGLPVYTVAGPRSSGRSSPRRRGWARRWWLGRHLRGGRGCQGGRTGEVIRAVLGTLVTLLAIRYIL